MFSAFRWGYEPYGRLKGMLYVIPEGLIFVHDGNYPLGPVEQAALICELTRSNISWKCIARILIGHEQCRSKSTTTDTQRRLSTGLIP